MEDEFKNRGESTPRPDPTVLTTQQLAREISSLKELLFTRIDGIDKDIDRFDREFSLVPKAVSDTVLHLRELVEEKFHSISTQFKERDTRTEQTQRDSKVAVDAALQAAKEAVGEQNKSSSLAINKSEAATTKQIESLQALIGNVENAIGSKIEDIKERISMIEGRSGGATNTWLYLIALGGLAIGAIGLFMRIPLH